MFHKTRGRVRGAASARGRGRCLLFLAARERRQVALAREWELRIFPVEEDNVAALGQERLCQTRVWALG